MKNNELVTGKIIRKIGKDKKYIINIKMNVKRYLMMIKQKIKK
ncbi:hypothetical protein [Photorhabdus luminescens]|nr:hypothetical protein [Photorhabdus luminescens]